MSKERPEGGDVWKHKKHGNMLYITDATDNYIDFISYDKRDEIIPYFSNIFSKLENDDRFEKFTETHEYLGKSKANINDLFGVVENE